MATHLIIGLLAASLLGAGGALAQTAPTPASARPGAAATQTPPAITALQGAWELSTPDGTRKCKITLRINEAKGGRAIGFPATCRRALPVTAKLAAWSVSDDGFVRLNDANGATVLAFEDAPDLLKLKARADGAEFLFDALGKPRRFVARTVTVAAPRIAFDPARAPPRETIPGTYGLLRYGGQEVCRIVLSTEPGAADGRFLARFPTRCRDKGLQVFDAVAWRYSGGRVHLIARRGHEMSLVTTADGVWEKDPPGGAELTARRVPN